MEKDQKIDRREFIKDLSLIGLGVTFGSSLLRLGEQKAHSQAISKIVVSEHSDAVTGVRINEEFARKAVDVGIMQFTGQKNLADAWASIFPSISPKEIVTIKVNCINSLLPTHTEVVNAIVNGLVAAGFNENNIIIWDRTNHELINCRYKYNIGDSGVRCFGSDQREWGYDKQVNVGNRNLRLSKILTNSDHLINVPVLKDHGMARVTLSMKNHYGSVNNPGILHDSECDPYIAELNNLPDIKDRTRLIVLDALLGIFIGGPGGAPQFAYNSVIIGQDPVAIDYHGWKILESERKKRGQDLPQPKHIITAAKLGLGTNDPNKIQVDIIDAREQFSVSPAKKSITTWGNVKEG